MSCGPTRVQIDDSDRCIDMGGHWCIDLSMFVSLLQSSLLVVFLGLTEETQQYVCSSLAPHRSTV